MDRLGLTWHPGSGVVLDCIAVFLTLVLLYINGKSTNV